MDNVTYTWSVLAADPVALTFTVRYSIADGSRPPETLTLPLPVGDQTVASVVEAHTPARTWMQAAAAVPYNIVGSGGQATYAPSVQVVEPPPPQRPPDTIAMTTVVL